MKTSTFVLLAIAALISLASAQTQQVFVHATSLEPLGPMIGAGDIEVMVVKKGIGFEGFAKKTTVELLKRLGYRVEVLNPDYEAYLQELLRDSKQTFGPYYTFSEAVTELNNIHSLYPAITSAPESIGTSHEGRIIWALKVSSSPNANNGKPGVLYNGVHHAREPITCSICLGMAKHLCQNYGTDSLATWLVDNRQIWIIPVLNPDGYVYNETDPSGSWRKNRRNNGGSYGVDPNRNYIYMWGYDNLGSSPDPADETYRGPSAGSEPEIQAIMGLAVREGTFRMDLNYHSYGDLWMFPWGYATSPTPDSGLFWDLAREAVAYNGYEPGQSSVINYYTNGDAKDWFYGEQGLKPKCFNFTVEVGSSFWQAISDTNIIVQQFNENLMPNLVAAQAAGVYLAHTGHRVSGGNGNMSLDPGETAQLLVTLKNKSMYDSARSVEAVLTSSDPYVNIVSALAAYPDLCLRKSAENAAQPFVVELDSACPVGHNMQFNLRLTAEGGYASTDTFSVIAGVGDLRYLPTPDNAATPVYYAVKDSDGVSRAPVYQWVEIRGLGTQLTGLNGDDQTVRVALPFQFRWYGAVYSDSLSVCSNGWVAFGRTTNTAYGNTALPTSSPNVPAVFPLWDDLTASGSWVGYYHDAANHRFIVEYDSVAYLGGSPKLKFQVIYYDSTAGHPYYDVVLQYAIYANPSNDVSIGFQQNSTAGCQLIYDAATAPTFLGMCSQKAIRITRTPDVTGVSGEPSTPLGNPTAFSLGAAWPNPVRHATSIRFGLPRETKVELGVYNMVGQKVATLASGVLPAGHHTVSWDGRSQSGQKVSGGVYFYRLATPDYTGTRRLLVLK
jgi:hypothetical protein